MYYIWLGRQNGKWLATQRALEKMLKEIKKER